MSSATPAYHLRTNKGVERLLFIELLRKLDSHLPQPVRDYPYVGMGGAFLEDFQLIQHTFANRKLMTSLETDSRVRSRQKINRPHCRIALTLKSTTDFVNHYETANPPRLVWFDYTNRNWTSQINDCCGLLPKLPPFSIFKVTFCARPIDGGENENDPLQAKANLMEKNFADFGPFDPADMSRARFGLALFKMFREAVAKTLAETPDKGIRSLASFFYDDGTPILTVTLLLGPPDAMEDVIGRARIAEWPYRGLNWSEPKRIDIPDLGLRERQAIDRLLPTAIASSIVDRLDLRLEANDADGIAALDRYITFYRHVPHFLRFSP